MRLHEPQPPNCQPWYAHSRVPLSRSMRPSLSGARRCAQASSITRQSPCDQSCVRSCDEEPSP
eukprot:3233281-Prymnesium_polylepis.1